LIEDNLILVLSTGKGIYLIIVCLFSWWCLTPVSTIFQL
jgi:hypothetical protein